MDATNTTPPLTQSDAINSLLSLSFAAEGAAPIPISGSGANANGPATFSDTTLAPQTPPSGPLASSLSNGTKSHRRLASTGKTRRRLSDAREAANRPFQTTAAALSLASLSLSSSPPSIHPQQISTSLSGVSRSLAPAPTTTTSEASLPLTDGSNIPQSISIASSNKASATPIPITNGKGAKKRGVDHKCESCSKIYRHPSCLIKHRWEHTPHWREASKFVLSKHQQVQLLEAAAILSHIAPSASGGTSLPEDRSLWPSFLSGGSLPRADPVEAEETPLLPASNSSAFPVSSSVPAPSTFSRSNSTGPRLHDYSIPSNVTQVRPGLVSVPTPAATQGITVRGGGTAPVAVRGTAPVPMPVPASNTNTYAGYRGSHGESWSSRHTNGSHYAPSSYGGTNGSSYTHSHSPSEERSSLGRARNQNQAAPPAAGAGGGGWSLPRSSLRSVSLSSQSRSRSNSASEESVDVDVDVLDDYGAAGGRYAFTGRNTTRMWKREEDELSVGFSVREEDEEEHMVGGGGGKERREEWDGMEMEMEMDMD